MEHRNDRSVKGVWWKKLTDCQGSVTHYRKYCGTFKIGMTNNLNERGKQYDTYSLHGRPLRMYELYGTERYLSACQMEDSLIEYARMICPEKCRNKKKARPGRPTNRKAPYYWVYFVCTKPSDTPVRP